MFLPAVFKFAGLLNEIHAPDIQPAAAECAAPDWGPELLPKCHAFVPGDFIEYVLIREELASWIKQLVRQLEKCRFNETRWNGAQGEEGKNSECAASI